MGAMGHATSVAVTQMREFVARRVHDTREASDMTHTILNPEGLHDPSGFGHSHAVSIPADSGLVLIARKYASAPDGAVVSADVADQVRQAFTLEVALGAHGPGVRDLVQLRTYVVEPDFAKLGMVGQVVREACGEVPPTQTTIGVAALATPEILLGVEAVAARS